jgi:NDP-sugar pyrophosphorylase family protein
MAVRGVLQAGGMGSRLYPATANLPKPLLKVGGVPMVERLLRQFVDAGIREITVITGFLAAQVESHLNTLTGLPDDLQIDILREPRAMGNIGALALLPRNEKPVLFAFGDLVTNLDFARLLRIHAAADSQATLTSHYENHRLTLGELVVDGDEVTGYHEKPLKQFLICSGIAVFERPALDLLEGRGSCGISDLINAALAESMKITHWTHGSFWMDINTPELWEIAERELARELQSPPAGDPHYQCS